MLTAFPAYRLHEVLKLTRLQVRLLLQAEIEAKQIQNLAEKRQIEQAKEEDSGRPPFAGSLSGASGAKTLKVDRRGRNVMTDVSGPASTISADKKHLTIKDPRALLTLRKTDGSTAFQIRDRRRKKKGKRK